ncbi:DNA helicase/exodeoxyribonuclease V gamma subunit [Acinetobacter calcoaceticus]|uniref:RecBCD enzyme subunit RecC n=1 Tax=Acinetobacter calcoaceticus TaxID=471 RepID=A0A4R1Y6S8_ACICA|nr:DNA helicase/exodeoxyribonuclease V gamma subunit [Acinetobacter calcoaceticus]
MGIHVIQSQRIDVLLQGVLQFSACPSQNPLQVLKTQHFVVPSAAVQEWLTQKISEQQGISANYQYHQGIRGFQWFAYQHVLEDKDQVRKANIPRLIMKWRIYQVLKPYISAEQLQMPPEHALYSVVKRIYDSAGLLENQLDQGQKKNSMLYWVAEQVSKLFSHYMLYRGYCLKGCGQRCTCRTNWLNTWGQEQALNLEDQFYKTNTEVSAFSLQQAEELETWQRWLWQQSFHADFVEMQRIDEDFWKILDDPLQRPQALKLLPPQLVVFTLLDLAPSQLQFLRRLGQYLDVMILHYNPSQEYWADSVDPHWKKQYDLRVQERFIAKNPQATDQDIQQFFDAFTLNFNADKRESRHPLLTRFGKQARDHFSLLSSLSSGEEGQWVDAFVDTDPRHLLAKLQSDILYLVEPEPHAYVIDPQDQSIQIHVCHSSLRQLEVLKEQLTHWLSQSSAAQPRRPSDIVVLVPDLKNIEPLIRSVFPAIPHQEGVFLPVKIAGVTQLDASKAWLAVLGRMQLTEGRFSIEDFADWLQLPAAQIRYALDVDMSERMLQLLTQAGFKRGLDAAHLARSLSAEDQDYRFSFKFALDRLVLGVAIPEHRHFAETLSFAQVFSDDFELISRLIEIYQDFALRRDWMIQHENVQRSSVSPTAHPKSKSEQVNAETWLRRIMQDISEFEQAGVESLKTVREIVKKQERMLTLASFYDQEQGQGQGQVQQQESRNILTKIHLPLPYLLTEIQNTLDSQIDQALPTGQITFSQIGQLRPLPYQLVVMLNLDGGKFPDRNKHLPFDLMQMLKPQLGDRSRLEDDQGAFLDCLLLAQEQLWLFYNGFDVSDGEVREPSSVLQELVNHLALISRDQALNTETITTTEAHPNSASAATTVDRMIEHHGIEMAAQLQGLYYIHPLQPFDPIGFEQTQPVRYQDHWFQVAQHLRHNNAHAQRQAWANVDYPLDDEPVLVLDAGRWIQDVIFPARLYLKTLGVKNLQAQELPALQEPLVLDGLGRYAIRDFLQQQDSADIAALDVRLLQDQLPVGKVQHSAWQMTLTEQYTLQQRLLNYASQVTPTTQRQWRLKHHLPLSDPRLSDLTLNVMLPMQDAVQDWVSMDASSARAKRRAKVWLEYVLWLAYQNLPDAEAVKLRRIALFSDATLISTGLTTSQAKANLLAWFDAYDLAQKNPLVLPAALLLQPAEKAKVLKWGVDESGQTVLENFDDLLKEWRADAARFQTSFSVEDNEATQYHRDWQFILQEQDAAALLKYACDHYAYALYQPIYQYQTQAEE